MPSRLQAMRWLAINHVVYPKDIPGNIGTDLFFGWQFIRAADSVVYFADCIHEGITEKDVRRFIKEVA